MHIKIKKGLTIPLKGGAFGKIQALPSPGELALDLDSFEFLRFSLLKKPGDEVSIGEPLAEDKECPGRVFVSPAAGTLKEVVRGLKRRILSLVIVCDATPHYFKHPKLKSDSQKELLSYLMKGGLFTHIRVRPCDRLPDPNTIPEAIFVKAVESAPFAPPPELELEGHETLFQEGLSTLARLCPVHLVHGKASSCAAFKEAKDVQKHTTEGPHPVSQPSLHISVIHPIKENTQSVWTLTVHDVIAVGRLLKEGRYEDRRVIAIAGEGIPENKRGYFRIPRGFPIRELIRGRCEDDRARLISGDPLMGTKVECGGYMKFFDSTFCVLPEAEGKRRFCHFIRPGTKSYTSTKTYFKKKDSYSFTTLQHGEERAFVDGAIYDRVSPLGIPIMHLVKALLAEDFELAKSLGLLGVSPEDFSLPSFICPSKIEMPEIVRQGLRAYAEQYL